MPRGLILVLFVLAQAAANCQLKFSKLYHTPPRSSALGIYNLEPDHFYITRYNRLAHDITIERRKKSDGSVAAFTALKLDSVNAPWFNYENLDHSLFMKDGSLFFVFTRVLNNKSELYMKRIDSLGKSSGFIQIMSMSGERNDDFLELAFTVTDQKQLLIRATHAQGTTVYRQVQLYEPLSRTFVYSARLPQENPVTGYSRDYLFDKDGNLYYLLFHHSYEWRIEGIGPPDLSFSTLVSSSFTVEAVDLVLLNTEGANFQKKKIDLKGVSAVHAVVPSVTPEGFRLQVMYSGTDVQGKEQIRFSVHHIDRTLTRERIVDQPLSEKLTRSLTFYDGSDYDGASRKNYSLEASACAGPTCYHFSERVQQNYFKELLVWQSDSTGKLLTQALIPRKILYFADRTRFRNLGKVMHATGVNSVYSFLIENRGNEKTNADEFSFHDFKRQETVAGANLVAYVLKDGACTKKIVYRNSDYSCVPVNYQATMPDLVLYLVKNDVERFGVVMLDKL